MVRNTQSNIMQKEERATQPNAVAPKMGMTSLWADEGILPVSGVTEWVINSNEGTEEGFFLVFSMYVWCLSIQVTVLLEKTVC